MNWLKITTFRSALITLAFASLCWGAEADDDEPKRLTGVLYAEDLSGKDLSGYEIVNAIITAENSFPYALSLKAEGTTFKNVFICRLDLADCCLAKSTFDRAYFDILLSSLKNVDFSESKFCLSHTSNRFHGMRRSSEDVNFSGSEFERVCLVATRAFAKWNLTNCTFRNCSVVLRPECPSYGFIYDLSGTLFDHCRAVFNAGPGTIFIRTTFRRCSRRFTGFDMLGPAEKKYLRGARFIPRPKEPTVIFHKIGNVRKEVIIPDVQGRYKGPNCTPTPPTYNPRTGELSYAPPEWARKKSLRGREIDVDFFDCDLSSFDFSRVHARGLEVSGGSLNKANFKDAYLQRFSISPLSALRTEMAQQLGVGRKNEAVLMRNADFSGVLINQSWFLSVDASHSDFSETMICDVSFHQCNLDAVTFTKSFSCGEVHGYPCSCVGGNKEPNYPIKEARMTEADFSESYLFWDFENGILSGTKFDKSLIRELAFKKCKARGTSFVGCMINRIKFRDSDFGESVFRGSVIADTDHNTDSYSKACNFAGADFSDCVIRGTFEQSDFSRANFRGTSFLKCTFKDCDLQRANFEGAKIHGLTFANCKLDGAIFKGAKRAQSTRVSQRNREPDSSRVYGYSCSVDNSNISAAADMRDSELFAIKDRLPLQELEKLRARAAKGDPMMEGCKLPE